MYRVEFLPVAQRDLTEIVSYIANCLQNPTAAYRLAEQIVEAADRLANYPYSNPVYRPVSPMRCEYRRVNVNNYLLFYTVEEEKQTVTVQRIIYGNRDCDALMTETDDRINEKGESLCSN